MVFNISHNTRFVIVGQRPSDRLLEHLASYADGN